MKRWEILLGSLLVIVPAVLFYSRSFVAIAEAQPAPVPAGTYTRMGLDAGAATLVPTTCMSARSGLEIDNYDSAIICCGWDSKVTCAEDGGTAGGHVIGPATLGVPGAWAVAVGCGNSKGNVYCYSVAGTAANAVGVIEVR